MISQTTGPISKIQTPFNSPERELSKHGLKFDLDVTDDVTGQVKVRMFDFSVLVTLVSTILMLSANKVNESAWVVLLTCVSIISCALNDHNTGQGHLRSPGKKGQTKRFRDLEMRYMLLAKIFEKKNSKNSLHRLFEASKSVKKYNSEDHGNVQKHVTSFKKKLVGNLEG